jgi:hypothetical protein
VPGTPGEAADAAAAAVGASRARAATVGGSLVGPAPVLAGAAATLALVHPGDAAPPLVVDAAATVTLEDATAQQHLHQAHGGHAARPAPSVASWTTATSTGAERTAWWTGGGAGGTFTSAVTRPPGSKAMRRRTPAEMEVAAARKAAVAARGQGLWSGRLDG